MRVLERFVTLKMLQIVECFEKVRNGINLPTIFKCHRNFRIVRGSYNDLFTLFNPQKLILMKNSFQYFRHVP